MGNNNNTKESSNDDVLLLLDNDESTLEYDKSRFNMRLRAIDPQIEIIAQIPGSDHDTFVLSLESMNHIDTINNNLLAAGMNGEINPHQYSVIRTQYKMSIPGWPRKQDRTTVAIERMALKKMGKTIFLRGFFKVIIVFIAIYVSFLLWSINK